MSKLLQISNDVFNYPTQGTGEGHGEDATAWAEAVTNALANFLGPNDVLLTASSLANGQTTAAVIPGLSFNTGQVQHVNIEFLIVRTYDSGSSVLVESGKILGNFNGSDFRVNIQTAGDDSAVELDVSSGGDFVYTSSDLANHVSSLIYFKAKTIDN